MTLRQIARRARDQLRSASEGILNQLSAPTVVLIYHRVIALPSDPQMLAVHPDRFRQQMLMLKEHFDIRRFEEAWDDVRRPTVVLTFDDGYADNLEFALPILEEVGVPATFFIATGYIGSGREFWWDELERLLLLSKGGRVIDALGPLVLPRKYACGTDAERAALYRDVHPLVKKLSIDEREQALAALAEAIVGAPPARDSHRVLDVAGLQQLAASPLITIGAHTVAHQPLSSLPAELQRQEIDQSRATLVRWLGTDVDVFSYPFGGRADYTSQTVDLCRQSNFGRVASNIQGVTRKWTDPYEVPRFLVRDWTAQDLLKRLRFFAGL